MNVNIGCTPIHPRHFQAMTPRQRRLLAERRRREVAAARAFHPKHVETTTLDPALVTRYLQALAPLFEELRTEQFCDCGRPAHARGMCWMHYDRWRVAMKLAREAA